MTGKEKRELLVRARSDGMSVEEMSRVYYIPASTIYDILRLSNETGSVVAQTALCGRPDALNEVQYSELHALLQTRPDITLTEIKEEMGLEISISALSRKIRNKLGYRFKKRQYTPVNETDRTL